MDRLRGARVRGRARRHRLLAPHRSLGALIVVALAGCGGHTQTAQTTTALTTTARPAHVAARAAAKPNRGAAAVELALAREDVVAGTLAARKASTPVVHDAALKRLTELRSDIATLAQVARPARLGAAQRRAYAAYYETLVENAGYLLDGAYERGGEARDLLEASLAHGSALLRRIARERRADDALLRTISG